VRKKIIILFFVIILTLQTIIPIEISIDSNPGIMKIAKNNTIFDENVTLNWSYYNGGEFMKYGLYTPSNANEYEAIPLIVWLHGSGEVGSSESTFYNSGLLRVLNKWTLEGFGAYVLCPHLTSGYWNTDSSVSKLTKLLDYFISEYNIDTNNIVIVGHSLGGIGALYMAYHMSEYFSKAVALSPYNPGTDLLSLITIPTICYVGTEKAGEDSGSVSFVKNYLKKAIGEENCFEVEVGHGGVPSAAFNDDTGERLKRNNRTEINNLI